MHKCFLLLITLAAQPAMAHPGEHHGNPYAALWHLLTEPDHLAFTAITLVIGVTSELLARRRAPKLVRNQHHDSR